MKTVSVFYLICVFIVLFASSSDAVRSQPDAELKVVHITLYSYSRKEDGVVSLTFLVWGLIKRRMMKRVATGTRFHLSCLDLAVDLTGGKTPE